MKLTYDPDANAAFIYLVDQIGHGEVLHSEPCDVELQDASVILDFGVGDVLLGIEILGARRLLSPSVIAEAERI